MGGAPKKDNFWSNIYVGSSSSSRGSSVINASRHSTIFSKPSGSTVTKSTTTPSGVDFLYEDGNPESKASLGKMHYSLQYLPSLLLFDVDVTTKESFKNEGGKMEVEDVVVQSRRLRIKALKEYISSGTSSRDEENNNSSEEKIGIPEEQVGTPGDEEVDNADSSILNNFAFDLEARFDGLEILRDHTIHTYKFAPSQFGRTNRIIIPVEDEKTAIDILGRFENFKDLAETKKTFKTKKADRSLQDGLLTCKIVRHGVFISSNDVRESGDKKKLYRRSLQLLFRQQKFSAISRTHDQIALEVPGGDEYWVEHTDRDIHLEAPWEYGVRSRFKFDDSCRMCINFDLVPFLEKDSPVDKYALYHFPESFPSEQSSIRKSLKRLLQGLRVKYPFSRDIRQLYASTARQNGWKHDNPIQEIQEPADRVYTIRDIKYNSDIGQFITVEKTVGDGSVETKRFTVKKYLEFFNAPLNKNSRHLPLADIGNVEPFWAPLDLLFLSDNQVPNHTGYLTTELKRLRELISAQRIAQLGVQIMNKVNSQPNTIFQFIQPDKPEILLPFTASDANNYLPLVSVSPKDFGLAPRTKITGAAPFANVSVMYITPKIFSPTTEEFLENVKIALSKEGEKDAHSRILDINTDEKISANSIKSTSELFRLQDKSRKENMGQLINDNANVFIGIIDSESLTTEKYKEAAAEIKRMGDRRLGVVTIAIDDRQLKERFSSGRIAFPENLLRKIRFMLGSINCDWDETSFAEKINREYPDGLIIVGAHISQPDSVSTEGCPAVASLVVSKASDPSFYQPIARVQTARECVRRTYDTDVPADVQKIQRFAHSYQTCIEDLQNIMNTMFRDWVKQRDTSSSGQIRRTRPRVVFYRDSYDGMDLEAYKKESHQIMEAYKAVFKSNDPPPLSYITIQKNNRRHIPTLGDGADKKDICDAPFSFTTSEYKADKIKHIQGNQRREEDGAKHQYHVHLNNGGSQMTLGKLRDLTILLNHSSQLGDPTSIALPVHYARKLARRVLSYYDWMSRKDISNHPNLKKDIELGDTTGKVQLEKVREGFQYTTLRNQDLHRVRGDRDKKVKEFRIRPWSPKLDDKMFFI